MPGARDSVHEVSLRTGVPFIIDGVLADGPKIIRMPLTLSIVILSAKLLKFAGT